MKKLILILSLILITSCSSTKPIELTNETCTNSGGTWNECGSACRGQDTKFCVEMCISYCECKQNEDCPKNYICGDYVEEIGICK